ncbi:hypothetical protein MKQ70_09595 [Chitinophaga sedimenti]|uniref:hypothetical protein n=1 Tax=Chitinophaga sedimenti TaxID=2033606 RepID=UPI00200621D6|nr:hypothetical protein [Chitinophaga sedimenti]MCK7555244.1 hypothetical protein [Chitinophaga sedimenti]
MLLLVQLTAGSVAAWASFHIPGEPILEVDFSLPAHLDHQEEIDIVLEKVQLKRSPRIKPRYYVSPFCQQYNLTPRLAYVLPYSNISNELQPENKTGEYSRVRSFYLVTTSFFSGKPLSEPRISFLFF